jgi:hypothetical protein
MASGYTGRLDEYGLEYVDMRDYEEGRTDKLSSVQKMYIGKIKALRQDSAKALAEWYGLKENTVRKYARRWLDDKTVRGLNGRPRILDSKSFRAVSNFRENMIEYDVQEMKDKLAIEYAQTTKRRNPTINDDQLPKKLKLRTKYRYSALLSTVPIDPLVKQQIKFG